MKLDAESDTVFVAESGPGRVVFARLSDGRVGLKIPAFGVTEPGPKLAEPPVLSAADRSGYVGRYVSEELDTWSVVDVQADQLRVRVRYGPWTPLVGLRKDEFVVPGAAIVFDRDKAGKVIGYRLNAVRSRNIGFVRRPDEVVKASRAASR